MTERTQQHLQNVQKFLSVFDLQYEGICPHCKHNIHPSLEAWAGSIYQNFSTNELPEEIYATLSCPHCHKFYFEIFESCHYLSLDRHAYKSINVYPTPTPKIELPADIITDYPKFKEIYTEAATAEQNKLFEICGMGYRKALEALVKSYALEISPNESEAIYKEPLMATIKRFPSDKISTLAQAAAWLGNDQTHFVVKHPEYDLEQLKTFIKALCQFIQYEKDFQKAIQLTQKTNN